MKTLLITVALISVAALTSCQKDPEENNAVRNMLIGQWKLDKIQVDVYSPIPVLDHQDIQIGTPSDSLVFKANGKVYSYLEDPLDPEIMDWHLINDSTLSVDDEIVKIRQLTGTLLHFHSDETYTSQNTREVSDIKFYR